MNSNTAYLTAFQFQMKLFLRVGRLRSLCGGLVAESMWWVAGSNRNKDHLSLDWVEIELSWVEAELGNYKIHQGINALAINPAWLNSDDYFQYSLIQKIICNWVLDDCSYSIQPHQPSSQISFFLCSNFVNIYICIFLKRNLSLAKMDNYYYSPQGRACHN